MTNLFNRNKRPKEPRKLVRLKLRVIDIWSATKVGFFVALAAGIGIIVGAWLIWSVLANSGVFSAVGGLLSSILGEQNSFNIESEFSFSNVMSTAMTLAALNLVITTALAAIYAAIFNLISKLIGGVSLTFTNN
ncbi:MAG: DUF3566 domain-containing protein [Pontimonas sp.]